MRWWPEGGGGCYRPPVVLALLLLLAPMRVLAGPQQVAVSVPVDLPMAQAWALLQDFSVPHRYVPGLVRTEIVSGQSRGVGAHRRVFEEDGDFLEETVIEWSEGRGFVLRLHEGDRPMMPFRRAEFSYRLSSLGANSTQVDLALIYQLPGGAVGEVLGDWLIRPVMEKRLVQVAAGLKHYYETGTPASNEDRARLAGAVQLVPVTDRFRPTAAP